MTDKITDIASPSEETSGTYAVTIQKEDGSAIKGFIDPKSHFVRNHDYPVYDSVTRGRAGNLVGRVSKEDFDKAVQAQQQDKVTPALDGDKNTTVTQEDGAKGKDVESLDPAAKEKTAEQEKSGEQNQGQEQEGDGKGVEKAVGIGALLMGLFSALKGGMGGLMTLIMGLVAGIFMSRAFSGNDQQQEQGRARAGQEHSRTPVKDLAGKLTELGRDENFPNKDFDLDKDGKVSMAEKLDRDQDGKVSIKEGEDAIGFKIDKDGDGKIDDKEMRALNYRLKGVIEKHPELAEISESFKKEMGKIAAGTTVQDAERQKGAAAEAAAGQGR